MKDYWKRGSLTRCRNFGQEEKTMEIELLIHLINEFRNYPFFNQLQSSFLIVCGCCD